MTSNKKLCLRSDSQNRQSFDERICDDLSEVILQYLSLEDKLKLECVSKQFQRTVFVRQFELKISDPFFSGKHIETRLIKTKGFNLKSFKILLKKCPNIRSIDLHIYSFRCNNYNKTIDLITKSCHNLVRFECPLSVLSDSAFQGFHRKFETKLKFLNDIESIYLDRLISFANIEELFVCADTSQQNNITRLEFNKLKKLDVTVREGQELLAQKLIETFESLRYLKLEFGFLAKNAVIKVLDNISKLKNLIHLQICTEFGLNSRQLTHSMTQIANNCQNLKSIECNIEITTENVSKIDEMLSPLKAFKHLKRLKLCFELYINSKTDFGFKTNISELFSFEAFKDFKNITHLTVKFEDYSKLDEKVLKDIDVYLPELQYLEFENRFAILPESTQLMVDILSRLLKLKTIKLNFINPYIFLEFRTQLLEKCFKIKSIDKPSNYS